MCNDAERYGRFLSVVASGDAFLNTSNVMLYELVQPFLREGGRYYNEYGFLKEMSEWGKSSLNAIWNSLPDFGGNENALAVINTSGSMCWRAKPTSAAVALFLGMYFAERNKGAFANHFIEFSARPQLIEIKGNTFADKLQYVASFNEVGNTNLESFFDLILNAAVKNNLTQRELPAKLIIVSDMEFDSRMKGASTANFENATRKFAGYGYKLPQVVLWNVASRNSQQPVKMNDAGVALVSGANPGNFSIVAGGIVSPYAMMTDILASEHYAPIVA